MEELHQEAPTGKAGKFSRWRTSLRETTENKSASNARHVQILHVRCTLVGNQPRLTRHGSRSLSVGICHAENGISC